MKTFADFNLDIPATATGEYQTTCTECSPHRKKKGIKCLSVNIDKGTWFCHHCGYTGGLKQGVESKANYNHWQKPKYRKVEYTKTSELPKTALEWFQSRGVTVGVLNRNKIGFGSIYMPQIEDFTTAINFPYYRGEEVVNVKYRDGKKNFRMEAGAERILYGLNDIGKTLIFVEGEIDKLSVEVAGHRNCVSVPDGAPSPTAKDYNSKFEFLENCEQELSTVESFILAVDNDEPGRVLQEELARRLGKEKCRLAVWPEGCKDANEVLVTRGADVLHDCIINASPYPVKGIYEVKDLHQQLHRLYDNDMDRGETTGWKNLDEHYRVRPGEWTVVTGIPGHGKSEFIDNLMVNMMWKKWRFAIFSPENQPLERHIAKLIEKASGVPFYPGPTKRLDYAHVEEATQMFNDIFTFILPDEDSLTIDGVLNLAKTVVFRKGIKGLLIDPWNELDHNRPGGLSETEYISQSLSKIRRFARTYGIHVWIVAHPAKMQKIKMEDGKMDYPVPTPYDISGSAHWRNKADNAISVYRNFKTESTEIHIQKIRFKEVGKVGLVDMKYEKATGRFLE